MEKLLKAACLLLSPVLFAVVSVGQEKFVVKDFANFGIETYTTLSKVSWGVDVSYTGNAITNINNAYVALFNTSSIAYTDDQTKHPNFGLGVAAFGRFHVTDDVMFMGRLGLEPGLSDSIALLTQSRNTTTLDNLSADGVIKSNLTVSPAVFMGVKGLYVGAMYEMRSYDFPKNHGITALNKVESLKDYQLLYGVRAEQEIEIADLVVTIGFEGMTNLYAEASDDIKQYYSDLVGTLELTASKVSTKVNRISVTLGAGFLSL